MCASYLCQQLHMPTGRPAMATCCSKYMQPDASWALIRIGSGTPTFGRALPADVPKFMCWLMCACAAGRRVWPWNWLSCACAVCACGGDMAFGPALQALA